MAGLAFSLAESVFAVEEAKYEVLSRDGDIELRQYEGSIVAETVVRGDFDEAGNRAFRKLFRYIDGNNEAREEIAMTAPVSQEAASEKIAMTAPVSQQRQGDAWAVSFMMPASYTMDTVPKPVDPEVRIREIPAQRVAAIRYSGFWSEKNYSEHLAELEAWLRANALEPAGEPVWARYDPPFKPWFMRRNEILVPVSD